jgi:hypothetical protein
LARVAHLARIDHCDPELGTPQLRHERSLVAAGRLHDHHLRLEGQQPCRNDRDPCWIIGDASLFPAWADRHIEGRCGHVDPHGHVRRIRPTPFLLAAPPTSLDPAIDPAIDPALQDTDSTQGWPGHLFAFIQARGATTQALLRPHGTAG